MWPTGARAQSSLYCASSGPIRRITPNNYQIRNPLVHGVYMRQSLRSLSSVWGHKEEELSPRQALVEIRNRKDHAFTLKV